MNTERFCCDGKCEQGRYCPAIHQQEDDIERWTPVLDLLGGLALVALCAFIAGWITR